MEFVKSVIYLEQKYTIIACVRDMVFIWNFTLPECVRLESRKRAKMTAAIFHSSHIVQRRAVMLSTKRHSQLLCSDKKYTKLVFVLNCCGKSPNWINFRFFCAEKNRAFIPLNEQFRLCGEISIVSFIVLRGADKRAP